MVTEFEVGTWGWDYDTWQAAFYPEDLPKEWRLGYYANEYRVGVIPASYWQESRPEEVQDWANELAAPFRLFVQMPALVSLDPLRGLPLAGILWNELDSGLAAPQGSVPVLRLLPQSEPFTLWSDPGGQRMVGRRFVQGALTPVELRALLEAFMQCSAAAEQAYLFIDGTPPDIGLVQQLGVLASLL